MHLMWVLGQLPGLSFMAGSSPVRPAAFSHGKFITVNPFAGNADSWTRCTEI
jgi:hypothetical protein